MRARGCAGGISVRRCWRRLEPLTTRLGGVLAVVTTLGLIDAFRHLKSRQNAAKRGVYADFRKRGF